MLIFFCFCKLHSLPYALELFLLKFKLNQALKLPAAN